MKGLSQLQGTWKFVSLEIEGVAISEDAFKESRIVIDGDTFTAISKDVIYAGTIALHLDEQPKAIDLVFDEGPEKGGASLGIYELEGDTLKLCLGFVGKNRPAEFASTPDSGHALEVLRKAI